VVDPEQIEELNLRTQRHLCAIEKQRNHRHGVEKAIAVPATAKRI